MNKNYYDVLIIGAGLSGIGTACHLREECPDKSLAILERRDRIGGTWDLFRYPGIRSDSDMLSYGYKFRPWRSTRILADGTSLRRYIQETAHEFGISDKIHYGLKITGADWSTQDRLWIVSALHEETGVVREYRCKYLICATGYYNHDEGFLPHFPGQENFKGIRIHPQHWPENLDYSGKKVVVIGSGATAATLIPSMADKADHVTMLQRSPSYIYSLPAEDKLTAVLSRILPGNWAYLLARKRNILMYRAVYIACRKWPKLMRKFLLSHVRRQVGPGVDMRHFTPSYQPWDERLCAVPDGDLFKAFRQGKASVETDHIERFTENGILLKSGKRLAADIIVTATGLKLQLLGGVELSIDGVPYPVNEQMTYKGVLLENMPNLAWIFGYTNISWTLKVSLAAKYLCRLFKYMDRYQLEVVAPYDDEGNALNDGIMDSMKSGYIQRDKNFLPRQGKGYPWKVFMNYSLDKKMMLKDPIEDSRLKFTPFRPNLRQVNPPVSRRAVG
ncbi:flavin-containing monooxygenase [Pseudomonas sp. B1-22]|uniref:flavin-containing monooxygenase n=1 Tax=Pseudomonas sp. B1-22 TaxID=3141456 RepID=UPI003D2C93F3